MINDEPVVNATEVPETDAPTIVVCNVCGEGSVVMDPMAVLNITEEEGTNRLWRLAVSACPCLS